MKKRSKFTGTILVLLVIGMLATSLSLASATPPTGVKGKWVLEPSTVTIIDPHWNGPNFVLTNYVKGSCVPGDLIAGMFESWIYSTNHFGDPKLAKTLEPKPPPMYPETDFTWNIDMNFLTCTVDGKTGTLTMHLEGKGYGNPAKGPQSWDIEGTWVIIKGTGDLVSLHGQGTWFHSRNGFAGMEYEGQIHFDP